MAFDGLVAYTIVQELKEHIIGGKIDKIFEPSNQEIILGIYSNGSKYALNANISSNHYRICLTTSAKPNPTNAPNFCMVLRKHLLNMRITNIYTLSLERVVVIELEGHNKVDEFEKRKLWIELMGKHSNIILTDGNNIIIDALKHFHKEENSYRNIIPSFPYVLPISSKLDLMEIKDANEFYNVTLNYVKDNLQIDENSKLSNIISNTYTGISKSSVLSILEELSLEDKLDEYTLKKFYEYCIKLINNTSNALIKQTKNDFSVLLSNEKEDKLEANFFIDDYYREKENNENFITYRNNLSKLLLNYMKKLNQKLLHINEKLKECKNTELYRLYGELITNNLYRINDNEHSSSITLENYYENNIPIEIPLDKSIFPSLNAKKYFKKYHKLRNTKDIVELQKKEVELEISYLESLIYDFEAASTISDIDDIYNEFTENMGQNKQTKQNKKAKKIVKKNNQTITKIGEPFEYKIDGFVVIVGKNNRQNDYITKKANDDDIWFHTKDVHGSHVILKVNGKTTPPPSQETINKCASLAAFYSKGNKSSNVSVDYTKIKYVKKPSNSKPGMVIYTNYKNVIVKPSDEFIKK